METKNLQDKPKGKSVFKTKKEVRYAAAGAAAGVAAGVAAGLGIAEASENEAEEENLAAAQSGLPETPQPAPEAPAAEPAEETPEEQTEENAEDVSAETAQTDGAAAGVQEEYQPTGGDADTAAADYNAPGIDAEADAPSTEEVVASIIGGDNIDPDDIELPTFFAMERFEPLYDEEGNEIDAAVVHTPDGIQYYYADLDGDGKYDTLLTADLTQSIDCEYGLTQSDLAGQLDEGGYMAFDPELDPATAPDIAEDITDTTTGEHPDVAIVEEDTTADDGELDTLIDELLAEAEANGDEGIFDSIQTDDADGYTDTDVADNSFTSEEF